MKLPCPLCDDGVGECDELHLIHQHGVINERYLLYDLGILYYKVALADGDVGLISDEDEDDEEDSDEDDEEDSDEDDEDDEEDSDVDSDEEGFQAWLNTPVTSFASPSSSSST